MKKLLPIAYEISRLISRILNPTPNGIDRLDIAYARHFLQQTSDTSCGMVYFGPLGHRSIPVDRAIKLLDAIEKHFQEDPSLAATGLAQSVIDWVDGRSKYKPAIVATPKSRRNYWRVANVYLEQCGQMGQYPARSLPRDTCYVCVSQFPLSEPGAFNWLAHRPDVKPVFFIHDLLPLQFPEYFKPAERGRHQQRLANAAAIAAGLLVSTKDMKHQLSNHLAAIGRSDMPVHISPVPLAPAFHLAADSAQPTDHPYFVACGTIEPRKNHLLLLNIWRELARQFGSGCPKLVLVGARGWENENVIDMLERSPSIAEHVCELNGLSTPELIRLMQGAKALLMPTFGEGYGLPVAEAQLLGVPVIASDIPVFHEITQGQASLISPLDGRGWMQTIIAAAHHDNGQTYQASVPRELNAEFADLNGFLAGL